MLFKRVSIAFAAILFIQFAYADQVINLRSPDGNIQLNVNRRDNGELTYSIYYKGKTTIAPSGLGFKLSSPDFSLIKFDLLKVDSSATDETWKPVWGEQSSIRNHYKQLYMQLRDKSGSDILLTIIFRVFNDGIGFRYAFPLQAKLNHFVIGDELTQFAMSGDHKTFWIPGDYDTNEFSYYTTKLSEIDATGGGKAQEIAAKTFF
jgi:hypothetical protein